jgi:hypothetical protein
MMVIQKLHCDIYTHVYTLVHPSINLPPTLVSSLLMVISIPLNVPHLYLCRKYINHIQFLYFLHLGPSH